MGFCSSLEFPFFFFFFCLLFYFNFLNLLLVFLHLFLCLLFLLFFSPCSYCLMYINLHLPLFNFAYLFFLSFPLNIFVSFVFIALFPTWHLALVWFSSLCLLVLFLTDKYNFFLSFVRWINLPYLNFVGLFWFCSCVYMCIFHYFNYYLPELLTAICLGFIFGFSFLDICFNLT